MWCCEAANALRVRWVEPGVLFGRAAHVIVRTSGERHVGLAVAAELIRQADDAAGQGHALPSQPSSQRRN